MNDLVAARLLQGRLRRQVGLIAPGRATRQRLRARVAEEARPQYWSMLTDELWEPLRALAAAELAGRHRDRLELGVETVALRLADEETPSTRELMRGLARAARTIPASRAELPTEVVTALEGEGHTPSAIDQMLTGMRELADKIPENDSFLSQPLEDLRVANAVNLAGIASATLAFAVARFNLGLAVTSPADGGPGVDELRSLLGLRFRALRDALVEVSAGGVELAGRDVALAARDAVGHAIEHAVRAAGPVPDGGVAVERDHYERAIAAADLVRESILMLLTGLHAGWIALLPPSHPEFQTWVDAASRLSLPSGVDALPRRAIRSVVDDPARYDGEAIELLGRVELVETRPAAAPGGKVVSVARLTDRSGRAVDTVVPWIHLDSGGMTAGAAAVVGGVWRASSSELGGDPGLEIDRLALSELARGSFYDWARHSLRHVYEPVSHGLRLRWSWVGGTDGAGNQLRYDTVAARSR